MSALVCATLQGRPRRKNHDRRSPIHPPGSEPDAYCLKTLGSAVQSSISVEVSASKLQAVMVRILVGRKQAVVLPPARQVVLVGRVILETLFVAGSRAAQNVGELNWVPADQWPIVHHSEDMPV
ncbi:MAG: hypothetical protein O2856_02380 [Planctomycetota bacterium]|nr:hypothetical protein [Planctomycetota bacterium]